MSARLIRITWKFFFFFDSLSKMYAQNERYVRLKTNMHEYLDHVYSDDICVKSGWLSFSGGKIGDIFKLYQVFKCIQYRNLTTMMYNLSSFSIISTTTHSFRVPPHLSLHLCIRFNVRVPTRIWRVPDYDLGVPNCFGA